MTLQPRERQILERLLQGMLLKQIAHELGITGRSCSGYITNARIRNDLRTSWQLIARFAVEKDK